MKDYTSKKSAPAKFRLDGVEFQARGGVPLLEMSELAILEAEDPESPAGAAAIATFFRALLGEEEYGVFREHCLKNDTDSDTIMEIMRDVIAEKSKPFPTNTPSDSSDGGTETAPTYRVLSSSGVSVEPMTPEMEAEFRALTSG